ncbi:thioesterase superfamily [Leptospira ryugenii]|uniref:Thioesterase superfamily n=1 Tax=Leptospira ryugenii TaxID=1917863 RepID=A0A2P2DYG5_9LEPT|nr:PaaI family thioesterase [Leptospira ryugenii]GBF49671.1 thioesterase superfamily [Leptospira ryugenii]
MINFDQLTAYKQIPNQLDGKCFACGPIHPMGLHMVFYTDETFVFSRLEVPAHFAGWSDLVHGGLTATILDETLAWTAIYKKQSFILTKSLQVDYLRPLHVNQTIYSLGSIKEVLSDRELLMEAKIFNREMKLAAKAEGKIVLFSLEEMKERKIIDESYLLDFQNVVFSK